MHRLYSPVDCLCFMQFAYCGAPGSRRHGGGRGVLPGFGECGRQRPAPVAARASGGGRQLRGVPSHTQCDSLSRTPRFCQVLRRRTAAVCTSTSKCRGPDKPPACTCAQVGIALILISQQLSNLQVSFDLVLAGRARPAPPRCRSLKQPRGRGQPQAKTESAQARPWQPCANALSCSAAVVVAQNRTSRRLRCGGSSPRYAML